MSLPAFLLLTDTAENRTLCRARALSKREAFVASGRGRRQPTEAGADLRSKYADSPRKASILYRRDVDRAPCPGLNPSTDPPNRGESNSMQGAGVKKTLRQRRVGRAFLTVVQRKLRPRISAQNGMQFPNEWLAESSSRNPASNWGALSAPSPQLQNPCALHLKTG